MNAAVLVAKLALALVFAVAAFAKLAERTSFRRTLPLYGVPARVSGAVAIAVPAAEIAVAATLVPRALAPWGAFAALGLLGVFTAAQALARGRGVEAECDCFGPLDPLSSGARPFVRNAALGAVAAFVATAESGGSETHAVFVAATAGSVFAVAGRAARLTMSAGRAPERPVTAPAVGMDPSTPALRTLTGETIDLRTADGSRTLLLFWNPSCPPCEYMLPRLRAWENARAPRSPRLVVVSSGSEDANRAAGLASPIVLEGSDDLRAALGIPGRPAAVLLDGEGHIASETILGAPAILAALGAPP